MELNTLLLGKQNDQEKETVLADLEKRTSSDDQVKETNETNENVLSCVQIIKTSTADDQEKEAPEKDMIVLPLNIINTNPDDLEDDDDGYKTPTSLDQRIPKVPLQCPPAPRKPKIRTIIKRKSSVLNFCNEYDYLRRIIHDVDIANEFGSMLPNSQGDGDLGAIKTKRSRK